MCNCQDYLILEEAYEIVVSDFLCYYCLINDKHICLNCNTKRKKQLLDAKLENLIKGGENLCSN